MPDWTFLDPPNLAVIAHKRIVQQGEWIAYVVHDADDGAWQFHVSDPSPPREDDAMVVSLQHIVELDPTIEELADLPMGWNAWRESNSSKWRRAPTK